MKKGGLFKLIFLVGFFVVFITVSVLGSMGLFKFGGDGDPDSPKKFSAEFIQTDVGYVFNMVSGRAAFYTKLGAVAVRFNKGEVGVGDVIYSHYSSVEKTEGGYTATAEITGEKGAKIRVADFYAIGDSKINVTRKIDVVNVGEEAGFATEYPILTQKQEKIADSDWFNPAQFYVSGTHGFITTNARSVLSSVDEESSISSNLTSALVLAKYKDGYVTSITDLSQFQQVSTYDDSKGYQNNLIIDEDISVTGISYANYVNPDSYLRQVKLSYCFPSKEQRSETGATWRLLPVNAGLSRTVSFEISVKAEDDFYSMVEDVWRETYGQMAVTDKRYEQYAVYTALLDSMQRSYSETQWGGIPQYLTNADHYFPDSGFLYRNADIALLMYKAGVRYGNQSYKDSAVKVLSKQIELDKIDSGITAYDKTSPVYYRVRYEGLTTVLDAYLYFKDNGINLSGTLSLSNLKSYIASKAETYKNETDVLGLPFFTKLWKYQDEFGVDVSTTALRLLNKVAEENRYFGGYFGSVENQGDNYIGVAEDAMIILNAYLNAYDVTHSARYLDLAKNCATWLETFNILTPMNMCLKGDDGTLPYNSTFIGNERFLAYGYNFNNTRHCILDCATVASAVDYQRLYDLTGDEHYIDFAQRLVYNSSIYVNMGDKVGLMDDVLHSSGIGFINEFAGNTTSMNFPDGGVRGAAHTSNIAWCGYQLLYAYDYLDANRETALSKKVYESDRTYDLAKYKLVTYDAAAFADYNYSPEKAVDGKKETFWKTRSSYAVIDLNEVCYIGKINIYSVTQTSATVKILVSADGENFTALTDSAFAGGDVCTANVSVKARYVKVQTDSDESIYGISVYGVPEFYHTFSYSATASGSGNYTDCLDKRNYDTAWSISGSGVLTLDLGSEKMITQCALQFENDWALDDAGAKSYQIPSKHTYKIEISSDGVNYTTYSETEDRAKSVYVDAYAAECRYVRLTVTAAGTVKLQDFKVMGCDKI